MKTRTYTLFSMEKSITTPLFASDSKGLVIDSALPETEKPFFTYTKICKKNALNI
jgi:hypothetical protein